MKKITWRDAHKSPTQKPNPRFPEGVDVDVSGGRTPSCTTALPYPAKRIGAYTVTCDDCRLRVHVTTAGRPDDPRSIKMACREDKAGPRRRGYAP